MDAVEVRRSPRARRWRLEVPWGEPARLTVPRWMSRAEVERLLVQEQPWLEEQRRRQVPRLGLEQLAVSESEARIGARELVSALAEEESDALESPMRGSGSETSAIVGVPALPAAPFPSAGGSC